MLDSFSSLGVNCSTPPVKPASGTWEWDGGFEYTNKIKYTCGPYGQFCPEGETFFHHYLKEGTRILPTLKWHSFINFFYHNR